MAKEKRSWWSINLWGGKKKSPPPEPHAEQAAPGAAEAPAAPAAPDAGPPPQAQPQAQDVSHAFEDLMGRYEALLGQSQGAGGASMAVVHRLLTEAEREAANLKVRARRQAEVEAAPLLAEAKRQAQETIAQANREAQRITEQQVGTILDDAHRRAELIEERAKQAAQMFLMRCREDVQSFVAMEAKEAFYKLLAPVNEVLATAQEVESTWKMRAVDLWQSAGGQLEDYQSTLFGSLGTGSAGVASGEPLIHEAPTGEPLVHETAEASPIDAPGAATAAAAEGGGDETEVLAARVLPHEDEERAEAVGAAAAPEVIEPPVDATPVAVDATPVAVDATPVAVDATPVAVDATPVAVAEPPVAEPPVAASEIAEPEAEEPEAEKPQDEEPKLRGSRSGRSRETEAKVFTPVPAPDLYEGELDLLIEPFTNVGKISKFYRDLGTVAGVRVLRTAGTWDKGTVITVSLDDPMSPASLDQRLPSDVRATPAKMGDDGWWKSAIGRRSKGRGSHSAVAIAFVSATEGDAKPPAADDDGGRMHDHDHEHLEPEA
ncbi:MAG: hypothetical protein IIC31_04980 [Chloroflexi bacterium]|nr:hypothetical protein [Chloroflexota bacterium]